MFAETVQHGPDRPTLGRVAAIRKMELDIDRSVARWNFDQMIFADALHEMRRKQGASDARQNRRQDRFERTSARNHLQRMFSFEAIEDICTIVSGNVGNPSTRGAPMSLGNLKGNTEIGGATGDIELVTLEKRWFVDQLLQPFGLTR